jgi:3-oxoacyl-[acyl-carrier-protein] synthase III
MSMTDRTARIVGLGTSLPSRLMTNEDFEKIVDTTHEWIVQRTGMKVRYFVGPDESLATLAVDAGKKALLDAGIDGSEVDLLVLATATPEQPIPSSASIVQPMIGLKNAACFDISAACSGFLYALHVAHQFIRTGEANTAMVIGAEALSRYTDFTDRATCILFGDGAGAVVLKAAPAGEGILASAWHTDGNYASLIEMPGGGAKYPPNVHEHIDAKLPFIKMKGNEVFKLAVRAFTDVCNEVLAKAGKTIDDVDLFIPHQANQRIISAVGDRLGVPTEKVYVNLERVGNTSSASIPLAMREAVDRGVLKRGDLVLAGAFGAGLTWAGTLLRW